VICMETHELASTITDNSSPLDDVKERLIREFRGRADVREGQVAGVMDEVIASFAHARIRGFLPILIERDVHRRLAGIATAGAGMGTDSLPSIIISSRSPLDESKVA
jgi:hypothetical protein